MPEDMTGTASPELSVVVVTAGRFQNIRRTVAHLRRQSIASRIELLIVAAAQERIADARPEELDGFCSVQYVYSDWADRNVDKASAFAVPRANAPFIALIEDHAYPTPEWAETILAAHHSGEWAAVAPLMVNANPASVLSWTNLLIAYGPWSEPSFPSERDALPGHNLCYRRSLLLKYGEGLVEKMGRSGGLLDDLQAQGERFYLSHSRLAHANPSRLLPTIKLRFNAGRLYGWSRATTNGWTPLHRVLYVAGGPVIPFLRFSRLKAELFGRGKRSDLTPRIWPALFFGLALDALGQMAGYAFGPGRSISILEVFEMDRMKHLKRSERRSFLTS